MPTPTIIEVRVTPDRDPKLVHVRPVWSTSDRPDSFGWLAPKKLAHRLVAAIKAGVALTNPVVKTDVEGKTYVHAEAQILGRYMNSDLKKLGF
jgi:hypothetical protein